MSRGASTLRRDLLDEKAPEGYVKISHSRIELLDEKILQDFRNLRHLPIIESI